MIRERALDVTLSMVSQFLEKIENSLREASTRSTMPLIITDDAAELLPAIKVWTDWMSLQMQIWSSPLTKSECFTR